MHVLVEAVKNLNSAMEKKSHNDATEERASLSVSSVELNSQNQKQEGVKNNRSEIVIFLRDICIILGIVLLLRTYIASPFRINGSSMESSYHNNELIIVDKVSYNLGLLGISKTTPER